MTTLDTEKSIQQLHIQKQTRIAAPIDIVFQTILDAQGPLSNMNLKLEPWVGGRWFRDLGNNTGHLWGHVQVIKPPKLLEIVGPLMMSYPVASHLQYRLVEEAGGTLLTLTHQAIGLITAEHLEGVNKGWGQTIDAIREVAEKKSAKR